MEETKLWRLKKKRSGVKIRNRSTRLTRKKGAGCLCFTTDSQNLLVGSAVSNSIAIYNLKSGKKTGKFKLPGSATSMDVSADGRFVGVICSDSHVVISSIKEMEITYRLPRSASKPTAIKFHPTTRDHLFVLYADNTIQIFDVNQCKLTQWSRENISSLRSSELTKAKKVSDIICGVAVDSSHPHEPILYAESYFAVLDTGDKFDSQLYRNRMGRKEVIFAPPIKTDKKEEDASGIDKLPLAQLMGTVRTTQSSATRLRLVRKYKSILSMNFIAPRTLLVSTIPWSNVLKKLPNPVKRKKYGT